MAAGFVRGVGFIPRFWLWRWLFSGWAAFAALAGALAWRFAG
jgi:predicted membrane protein